MFTLNLDDNKIFKIENPKLKGAIGSSILSMIKDLEKMTATDSKVIDLLLKSGNPKIKAVMQRLINGDKEAQKEIQGLAVEDPALILKLQQSGNFDKASTKLLYEILQEILEYYREKENLDSTITTDDFYFEDVISVLIQIVQESKNSVQSFLELLRELVEKPA